MRLSAVAGSQFVWLKQARRTKEDQRKHSFTAQENDWLPSQRVIGMKQDPQSLIVKNSYDYHVEASGGICVFYDVSKTLWILNDGRGTDGFLIWTQKSENIMFVSIHHYWISSRQNQTTHLLCLFVCVMGKKMED